jgi:O-antigen ligase
MLFGIGPDHLVYAQIIMPSGSMIDKTHNIYLEKAVTVGGLALLAYLVFLALVLCNRRKGD